MATSPTSGPGGSGGGLTEQHGAYYGAAVNIANNGSDRLTWNTKFTGTELFDRTDTKKPAVLAAGVYIVAVTAVPGAALTAGGKYKLEVFLDGQGVAVSSVAETAAALDPGGVPLCSVCSAYYIPLGGTVEAVLTNYDGVAARDFLLSGANVQRLA